MFKKNKEDDDLFLSDIGSLAQIYDKKQRFGKNFNPNYKKRLINKPGNPYLSSGDKRGKPFTRFDKPDRNSGKPKDAKGHASHSKSVDDKSVNLYDDEDIQVLSQTTPKDDYPDNYDEFELNVNPNESPNDQIDTLTSTKNNAPWRLNRESRQENDAKRLLEYERSFKNDELGDDYENQFGNPQMFEEKQYPEHVEERAKTARSRQRERIEFDKNYSKWAYDDVYDNEDKSFEEKSAPYDPEQAYNENAQEVFNRERFSNPENPTNEELLDENYPNMAEIPRYHIGKILVQNKLEQKLRKDDRLKKSNTQKIQVHEVFEREDEDVVILDDSQLTKNNRVQNEVNKKIKISFNTEHKPKAVVNESIFPDEPITPDIISQSTSGQKIPVLSRIEPPVSQPASITPSFPPPVNTIPVMGPPRPSFPNTVYPVLNQNFVNYSTVSVKIFFSSLKFHLTQIPFSSVALS